MMTECAKSNVNFRRRLLVFLACIATGAVPVVCGLIHAGQVCAQATDRNERPGADAALQSATFEAASIHPDKPSADGRIMSRIGYLPNGTFTANGITMLKLLSMAYGVDEARIIGTPGWLKSDRFTIEAKPDSDLEERVAKLSPPQRILVGQRMMQAMLADRLKLAVHQETKELPILALVVAKSGSKLHEAKPGDTYPNGLKGPDGQGRAGMMRFEGPKITAQGISLDALATLLTERLQTVVQNKTGLKGMYDFSLEWTPDEHEGSMGGPPGAGGPGGGAAPDSAGPSIYTAIQEQMGLRLEAQKGPVSVFVIDHVGKPSEN